MSSYTDSGKKIIAILERSTAMSRRRRAVEEAASDVSPEDEVDDSFFQSKRAKKKLNDRDTSAKSVSRETKIFATASANSR